MATFQARVQALTQLTMGTDPAPSTTVLTQFLIDGVLDVTEKWLLGHPQDIESFARESAEQTSNASLHLNGARIISVVRESGINNDWRSCRKIPASMQSQVVDTDSLSFASKYHPVYMLGNNGQVSVFPAADTGGADSFKVYYVNNDPEEKGGSNLAYSHSDIKYFDDDKVYLVVLYAAIQSLKAAAGNQAVLEDTELVSTYSGLANSLTGEYNSAFQIEQPAGQPAGQPASR